MIADLDAGRAEELRRRLILEQMRAGGAGAEELAVHCRRTGEDERALPVSLCRLAAAAAAGTWTRASTG